MKMAKESKSHQYNTWWIKTPTKTEQKDHSFSEELQHLIYNTTLHSYRWLVNANISNWETYVPFMLDLRLWKIYFYKKILFSQLSVDSHTCGRRWRHCICAGTRLPTIFNKSDGHHIIWYVVSNWSSSISWYSNLQ